MNENSKKFSSQICMALISTPKLERNLRGQVKKTLQVLPANSQKKLACDFSEHGLKVLYFDAPEALNASLFGLNAIREFMKGNIPIDEVQESNRLAIDLDTVSTENGYTVKIKGIIQMHVIECCCQREMEAAGFWYRNRYQPDAFVVASEVCMAIARYAAGDDWDSKDAEKKAAARIKGRQASDSEAIWQRERIVQCAAELDEQTK